MLPGRDEQEDWVDPQLEPSPFAAAEELADAAAARLDQIATEVENDLGSGAEGAVQRNLDELKIAAASLRAAFAGEDDAVAEFEGVEHPYDRWRLAVRPLSPASAFREALLDRLDTFVGVSASLLIEDSAFAALGELEIEESESERLRRISLPSPFPYAEHMKVVALKDRGDLVAMTAEAIERLAVPLGGRTLALFTSLRRMRDVAERLTPTLRPLGIEIITPRRAADDPSALLERFRRGSAVLLGARKFWQGVDLPGDTLQAVVIEKLPFEVPTELRRRRELRLRRAGRDPFRDVTLGKMLLNLKQMAGRLIRSEDDRGLVVIVESRSDRRYFHRLREALPPGCPLVTAELRDLEAMLKELGLP
jgi:Rad3-related DNA helicase